MKHFKTSALFFAAAYATVSIVACSKKSDDNNTPAPAAVTITCPTGATLTNGLCIDQFGRVVSPLNNSATLAFSTDTWNQRTMTITNGTLYKAFLKEAMGTCDRTDGYSAGTASCDSYLNGYSGIVLQANDANAQVVRLTLGSQAGTGNYGWYSVSLPTVGQAATCGLTYVLFGGCMTYATASQMNGFHNPLALDMTVSVVNNSQGFEARSYGAADTYANRSLIQFIVNNGKLQDGYFDYQLAYKGQSGGVFATGRMIRCNSATCGM